MLRGLLFAGALLTLATLAQAETVDVKYRGEVNLRGFDCQSPSSSFVHRICYDEGSSYVVVLLRDTYYHYCRVPAGVVSAWLSADSQGKFYNARIKGNFDCRQGGVP